MSDFEFIFALFGLLLGLSLTEVLGGLARAIDRRWRMGDVVRIGWLTPLLGVFVLLDLLSFWQAAWSAREVVGVSRHALLAVTMFAGAYYFGAYLVFPREGGEPAHYDDHFFRVRRTVIGIMFALLVCQLAWYASVPAMQPLLLRPLPVALTVVLGALMTAAMAVRSERVARWVMAALVARYLLIYLL